MRLLAENATIDVTLSLAGRTADPVRPHGVAVRVGGFGGAEGLARWLVEAEADAVIDATHPFAAQISANAVAATDALGLPLCTIIRPPWIDDPFDRWRSATTIDDAAMMLGAVPHRVFLSVGRQGVGAFRRAQHHAYIIRSIERPDAASLPPNVELIQARGPFAVAEEMELLQRHRVDVVVTKNAGGDATSAKIDAARRLKVPIIMIERPVKAGRVFVSTAQDAVHWLESVHAKSRSERGV